MDETDGRGCSDRLHDSDYDGFHSLCCRVDTGKNGKWPGEAGPDIAVAETTAGKVQGYISNGIYTYHGIPYAQADERFTEAHEAEPWEGVRMAFDSVQEVVYHHDDRLMSLLAPDYQYCWQRFRTAKPGKNMMHFDKNRTGTEIF